MIEFPFQVIAFALCMGSKPHFDEGAAPAATSRRGVFYTGLSWPTHRRSEISGVRK
jgi:hypothetical protein